jgi:ketose-bisphosphate aldolase
VSLESIGELMQSARQGGYAVGYFESWNLESLQGVLDAAEETRSPIIVGFNGDFLSLPGRAVRERLPLYAALGKAAAETASVPCGLIFNECPRDEWVREAIGLGFNLVMPADPAAPVEEYTRRVATLTKLAHERGVCVEAELGDLPCGLPEFVVPASGGIRNGSLTDPAQAAAFVEATGVDLLAISVGNVHIKVNGDQPLDLDRLAAVRKRVSIPLVLHGGTGIAADSLREAVTLGVTKVNYGTYLKQRYLEAVRAALACDDTNPHALLGMGGPEDAMLAGRRAVREAVLERIELLGCCGKG